MPLSDSGATSLKKRRQIFVTDNGMVPDGLFGSRSPFRLRDEMFELRVGLDAFEFLLDDPVHLLADTLVVFHNDALHAILAVFVPEDGYLGNGNVGGRLAGHGLVVHDDLGVKDLLVDLFSEVVGHGPDEHALRQVADLRGRDERIELRTDRAGLLLRGYGHGFAPLQDLAETLGERLGRFAHNLPGEDVAHGILYHGSFFIAIIAFELRVVLKTEAYGHLVRTGRGDQVVQPSEIKNIGNPQFKIRY